MGDSFAALCERASELVLSISPAKRTSPAATNFHTSTPARSHSPGSALHFQNNTQAPTAQSGQTAPLIPELRHPHAPPLHSQPPEVLQQELEWETQDQDLLIAARAFFEAKEFVRAAHWLRSCQSSKARFLSIYSEYMVNNSYYVHFHSVTMFLEDDRKEGTERLVQTRE